MNNDSNINDSNINDSNINDNQFIDKYIPINRDAVEAINLLAGDTIASLINKYQDNKYALGRINSYMSHLPSYIESDLNNYIKRQQHSAMVSELLREFVDNYIYTNNYWYCVSSEIFYKYDELNYFTYREDTILYEISYLINRNNQLINYKNRIKHMIIREIKERNILDSIPDTSTIQLVINNMLPLFLNNKTYVKYFLIVIGDLILKKDEEYSFLIDTSYKRFIKMLSDLAYQYFGTNHFTNIKYGYHELQRKCRIIYADKNVLANRYNNTIENLLSNLNSKNNNNFLDVFIVAVYYSNRYESSDKFIDSDECEKDIAQNILLLDNNNTLIIERFIIDSIQSTSITSTTSTTSITSTTTINDDRENNKITNKNMQYLWKLFLIDNNLPSINFISHLKCILREKIEYSQQHDAYLGVTSKKLPLISNFLEFWNTTIFYTESEFIEDSDLGLEISEVAALFKYWLNINNRNISNVAITERSILDLINYYYEDVHIEDEKYLQCISNILWDKKSSILDFFKYCKKDYLDSLQIQQDQTIIKKSTINTNNLYTQYCKWCKSTSKKFVVGKHYFQKYTNTYFNDHIKENLLDVKHLLII